MRFILFNIVVHCIISTIWLHLKYLTIYLSIYLSIYLWYNTGVWPIPSQPASQPRRRSKYALCISASRSKNFGLEAQCGWRDGEVLWLLAARRLGLFISARAGTRWLTRDASASGWVPLTHVNRLLVPRLFTQRTLFSVTNSIKSATAVAGCWTLIWWAND